MNRLRPWLVFRKQLRLAQSRSYQSIRRFNLKQNLKEDSDYSVILPTEPFVFGVSHIQPRSVPDHIVKPPYARGIPVPTEVNPLQESGKIELGGEAELKIREAALLAKKVREFAGTQVKVRLRFSNNYCQCRNWFSIQVGSTTNAVDAAVHDFIISHSAYPSPLLYSGFPRSCCTRYAIYLWNQLWNVEHWTFISVNNIIAHGIPDEFVRSYLFFQRTRFCLTSYTYLPVGHLKTVISSMLMLLSSWMDTTVTRHKHFLSETSWVLIYMDFMSPYGSFLGRTSLAENLSK